MTDLPTGWVEASIDEIAVTSLGKMLDRGRQRGFAEVPYLRNVNVQWGRIDTFDILTMEMSSQEQDFFGLAAGDLLVCEGGEIGRCAIWNGRTEYMAFQKALHRVRPCGGIESRYIRWALEHMALAGSLAKHATGSTIQHLPQVQLRELRIPLPPLAEQRRIVDALEDHLSRLDAAVRLLRSCATRLDVLRQSAIDASFDVHGHGSQTTLDSDGSGDHPHVPSGWKLTDLDRVNERSRPIRYGILMPRVKIGGVVPYVEVKDLAGYTLEGKTLHCTSPEIDEKFAGARIRPGDVVIAVRGSYERTAVVPPSITAGANLSRDVARISPVAGVVPEFLHLWLRSSFVRGYLRRHARGVAVKGVNISTLRAMPIVLPSESEQKRIATMACDQMAAVARIAAEIRRSELRASHLRRSLLDATFSGRLVPQDPADEPADLLLKRIAEERETAPGTRPSRRTVRS